MRLIDVDNAIDALNNEYHGMLSDESMKIYQIKNWLSALPSEDAVKVIRCEECIFYMAMGENRAWGKCRIHDRTAQDIDYCSWGERREP